MSKSLTKERSDVGREMCELVTVSQAQQSWLKRSLAMVKRRHGR